MRIKTLNVKCPAQYALDVFWLANIIIINHLKHLCICSPHSEAVSLISAEAQEKQLLSSMRRQGLSQMALVVKNPLANAEDVERWEFNPWVGKIPWRRAQQPTSVFLPGKSHRERSLVGCCPVSKKSWTGLKWLSTHAHTEYTSLCYSVRIYCLSVLSKHSIIVWIG